MKILLTLLLATSVTCFSCGQSGETKKGATIWDSIIPPAPIGWVSDFEKVFSLAEVAYLDSIIGVFEEETSNEITIVSLEFDPGTVISTKDFEDLSLALFRKWGVGKKGKNNGVGILFSVALRKIRIETGYGLEAKFSDEEAKKIIDRIIIPEFKKADYFKGIEKGVRTIMDVLK